MQSTNNEHGLPILDLEIHEVDTSRPTVSSISDGVNYYEFEPAQRDLDIMEYLFRNREEISKTVQTKTHAQVSTKGSTCSKNDASETFG